MYRTRCVLVLLALCVGWAHSFSWDIVVARSNRLEFYNEETLAHIATPVSHHIKWITYDPVHDRVLFAEKYNREGSVSSFNVAKKTTQSLIKKKTIQYLGKFAYDPATELLFGIGTKGIYAFPLGPEINKNVNGALVINLETIPRELAVDSCGGHIYWTSNNIIERALFNGLEKDVVISNTSSVTVRQGLTVDSHKIYWIETQEFNDGVFTIESADLDGKNRKTIHSETDSNWSPDKLTVSKDFIFWGDSIEKFFWQLPKNPSNDTKVKPYKIAMNTAVTSCGAHDIAANYIIEERTHGVPNCNALFNLLPDVCVKPSVFCKHGTKVLGESRCDCTQGFIGDRCDVSVCENYCSQGDCNINDEGQPICRCNESYTGKRCDVSVCENYCFQGDCKVSAGGQPTCRCNAGYSGKRCEVNACHKHCLNNGKCSLNTKNEPVCQCPVLYKGERCDQKADQFVWVPMVDDKLPPDAIVGGIEGGKEIYIARAHYEGWLNPGKYVKETNTAYIPWGGKELIMKQFEILCGFNTEWVKTDFDNLPKNAIHGGSPGDPVYVCRSKIENSQDIICGKAHGRFKNCYLSYHGKEIIATSSEILVTK